MPNRHRVRHVSWKTYREFPDLSLIYPPAYMTFALPARTATFARACGSLLKPNGRFVFAMTPKAVAIRPRRTRQIRHRGPSFFCRVAGSGGVFCPRVAQAFQEGLLGGCRSMMAHSHATFFDAPQQETGGSRRPPLFDLSEQKTAPGAFPPATTLAFS